MKSKSGAINKLSKKSTHSDSSMSLNKTRLEAAKKSLDDGAVTPSIKPYAKQIVSLLQDALATEWVCVLRYRRHHFTAKGMSSPAIAAEFMVHATEESAHADLLAERIVQLGGAPDLNPNSLVARSHADYDDSLDLKSMIRANLVAERVAIESYRQMIELIGDNDTTTRKMLEGILADEEEHADEMADLLDR